MQLRSQFCDLQLDDYSIRELRGELVYKARHRQSVVDFLADSVDRSAPVKMFGLPGVAWRAENAFVKLVPDATFVGLERDRNVFFESSYHMPGGDPSWAVVRLNGGGSAHLAENSQSKLLMGSLEEFLLNQDNRWLSTKEPKLCSDFSCIWLDTWAVCRDKFLACLSNVSQRLNPTLSRVPFALTLVGNRGNFYSHADRVQAICSALDLNSNHSFSLVRSWVYKNDGKATPMLNVMGYLNRKK